MIENEIIFEIRDINGGNILRIIPHKLLYPDAEIEEDRQTLSIDVEASLEKFASQVKYQAEMRKDDFLRFKNELEGLNKNLSGEAIFETTRDGYVEMRFKGDGIGHFGGTCIVTNADYSSLIRLEFEMNFDQTQIPVFVKQLERIIEKFSN